LKRKVMRDLKYILFFIIALAVIVSVLDNTAKIMFPEKYKQYVMEYSRKNNLDPYLVFAIIKVESNFNTEAVSQKNARGLMQISQKTGQWGARVLKLKQYTEKSLFDPETNISIGCWYLSVLIKEFGDLDLVIAAYNGGSGNVKEWLKNKDLSTSGKSLDKIPFKETETYLKKVKSDFVIYKKLYENKY
jgi:soluble lytic murein transglycosylase